ncbi:GNAT family N-acetyltransferase [Natronosalvus vescus]|uniref:GNAT family N-acetyltransferase n=1 Tax=Natronosalvus vescus TaxID=2953881 RepID=UPI0020911E9F|nr:GNAT family N-acetyltransferase [Natronosalvus vescus]
MTRFDLEIRPATPTDAAAIARLYRRAYRSAADLGYPSRMTEIDAETVADWLERDATTLVALESTTSASVTNDDAGNDAGDDAFVGTVRLLEEREEPYLERLAVHPERQGDGVATTLVDRIETIARERGYDCIQLTTFDEHPFLIEWYRSRGYEPIEHHETDDREYDFVTMEKPLSATTPEP